MHGTHRASTMPLLAEATVAGRPVAWTFIHLWRVADGMIVEHWACRDDMGLLEQLRGETFGAHQCSTTRSTWVENARPCGRSSGVACATWAWPRNAVYASRPRSRARAGVRPSSV